MFFTTNKDSLGQMPRVFRYLYFVLSSFRLVSFRQWKAKGEPNPFVSQRAKRRHTSQQEIIDIFQDKI
jgi:hypothetical protein